MDYKNYKIKASEFDRTTYLEEDLLKISEIENKIKSTEENELLYKQKQKLEEEANINLKKYLEDIQNEYSKVAEWCNISGKYRIISDGEYLKVVPFEIDIKLLKQSKKTLRNNFMQDILDRIDRYRNQKEAGLETSDTSEIYIKLLHYLQYLRDYPESSEDWFEENPLDFKSWEKNYNEN